MITANDLNEMALEFGLLLKRMDELKHDPKLLRQQIIRHESYINGIEASIKIFLVVAKRSNHKVDIERFNKYVEDVRSGARDATGKKVTLKVVRNA